MKTKELKNMTRNEREKKLKEIKLELIKSRVSATKTGSSKTKQAKKIIARILTLNKTPNEGVKR
ncbi:MAG: 50S ribosomal protein L29 [Nanoarchaeota archaeon]|nr:50S ribosomal protein L29 [Nanoarchaeota archaeon]